MDIQEDTTPAEPGTAPDPAPTPEPTPAEPGTPEAPAHPAAPTDQAQPQPAKEPGLPLAPVWADPDDITPEVRAYYWELERQLGRRQHQLRAILDSDDYHDNPVDPVRAETLRILRHEVELLDKAWGYPPFTIKDWDDLPESLYAGQEEAAPDEETPAIGIGEQRRLLLLKLIRGLGLDPLAIRPIPHKDMVRARYMDGYRARGQAHKAATKAFNNTWDQLRADGRIQEGQPPKF